MQEFNEVNKIQNYLNNLRQNSKTIGFVPTMGALHQGHLSLVDKALSENEIVVVSIFVNPTQFGPNEDFQDYPRQIEKDLLLLQEKGVSAVFVPSKDEIYPDGIKNTKEIYVPESAQMFCGKSRPYFFQGVCKVVLRLFNIITPDQAYFGEKDFQQLVIIKKMVQDLFLDIEIIGCPIIREDDGLAMSSRNAYLNLEERKQASQIFQALSNAKDLFDQGETKVSVIKKEVEKTIQKTPLKIDYIAIVDPENLEEKENIENQDRLLIAGWLGKTRLIDNVGF